MKKLMAICAIMIFGVINLSVNNSATENVIHFETYKVRAGDTFWDIANYYREKDARNLYIFEYQDEMREMNPHLKARQYQLQPNDLVQVKYVTKAE